LEASLAWLEVAACRRSDSAINVEVSLESVSGLIPGLITYTYQKSKGIQYVSGSPSDSNKGVGLLQVKLASLTIPASNIFL